MDREFLVIGGTGMLHKFCSQLPAEKLVVAARFISNDFNLKSMDEAILKMPFDYSKETDRDDFLEAINGFNSLKCCIIWMHSQHHAFSLGIIEELSKQEQPPKIIHLFGSTQSSHAIDPIVMEKTSSDMGVEFSSIKLGSVKTENGTRWLTNSEISELTWRKFNTLQMLRPQ